MNQPQPSSSAPALEVSLFRDHCIALLRRYFCMSIEVGRLPALLGRECFRTQAQDYHVHSFEDIVLFVIDIERCLDALAPVDRQLISYVVLQEYTQEEAAKLLGYTDRQIRNRFPEALDALTALLLDRKLLNPGASRRKTSPPTDPVPEGVSISCCAEPDSVLLLAAVIAESQFVPASAELP